MQFTNANFIPLKAVNLLPETWMTQKIKVFDQKITPTER